MSWWWRLEGADGTEVESSVAPGADFPQRADAESWIGETWQELLDDGVAQVVLLEDGREVYGPMSLSAG